jgi:predicted DNA-binding transcriptional regulator AlpA
MMTTYALRPPAAATYVGLTPSTLAKMRLRGDGPTYVKVGQRAVAYLVADLDAWLLKNRRRSTSEPQRAA